MYYKQGNKKPKLVWVMGNNDSRQDKYIKNLVRDYKYVHKDLKALSCSEAE